MMDKLPEYSKHSPRIRWENGRYIGQYCAACGFVFTEGVLVELCPGRTLTPAVIPADALIW